jgi:hypothetical protein
MVMAQGPAFHRAPERRQVFVATVQIAVFAKEHAEACDAVSECLTNNLQYNGAIIDWAYLPDGDGGYKAPEDRGMIEVPIEEGELFRNLK